jgi:tetratricopeptide (TPR) repeat protein
VQKLETPDSHHLDAAIGWLGLGCAADARQELEKISQPNQLHPDVLEARWLLFVHEKRWDAALEIAELELKSAPDDSAGWLHRAYALRRVSNGGLPQAWAALRPAVEQFPEEPVIAFNLSCYACQMEQLDVARVWLKRALATGGAAAVKKMALADDDLKPLWPEIKEL